MKRPLKSSRKSGRSTDRDKPSQSRSRGPSARSSRKDEGGSDRPAPRARRSDSDEPFSKPAGRRTTGRSDDRPSSYAGRKTSGDSRPEGRTGRGRPASGDRLTRTGERSTGRENSESRSRTRDDRAPRSGDRYPKSDGPPSRGRSSDDRPARTGERYPKSDGPPSRGRSGDDRPARTGERYPKSDGPPSRGRSSEEREPVSRNRYKRPEGSESSGRSSEERVPGSRNRYKRPEGPESRGRDRDDRNERPTRGTGVRSGSRDQNPDEKKPFRGGRDDQFTEKRKSYPRSNDREVGAAPRRTARNEEDKPFGTDRSNRSERPDRDSSAPRGRYPRGEKPFDNDKPVRRTSRSTDGDKGASRPATRSRSENTGRSRDEYERPAAKTKWDSFEHGARTPGAFKKSKYSEGPARRPRVRYEAGELPPIQKEIRLNRYISMSGICSRREADDLIIAGVISVNGTVITEMGHKVSAGDDVRYNGERIKNEKTIYLLLNKPKDYITTAEDPEGRKTVMELISGACDERVYPVGRLDRNTTGLLLFTNDGDLARFLTHPSSSVRKIYAAELDKNFKVSDMQKVREGLTLEDGKVEVDDIDYDEEGLDKKKVGVEIHSGKNRIVRRIFEHLGYEVKKLDRVIFAGLTKKDLPRGRWRFLTEAEVNLLKISTGAGKKKVRKPTKVERD